MNLASLFMQCKTCFKFSTFKLNAFNIQPALGWISCSSTRASGKRICARILSSSFYSGKINQIKGCILINVLKSACYFDHAQMTYSMQYKMRIQIENLES